MKKRLIQSLIITTFLLVTIAGSKHGEKEYYTGIIKEAKKYSNNFGHTACAGAFDNNFCIMDMPDTNTNETIVVGEPEISPIEQTELFQSYIRMGYSSEQFYEDLALLEAITIAEAGNQSELGKRLVIDTVLNRIDSDTWRDDYTIREVIIHPYQFETYTTGAYTRVAIDEDISRLVEEEILNRTNRQVIYFRTGGYFSWAPALFKEGDHYFSGEEER